MTSVLLLVAAAGQGMACAQGAVADVVVRKADGTLVAPWVERRICVKDTGSCQSMIVNSSTNEVAQAGDRWASRFEPTGNGAEIIRSAPGPKPADGAASGSPHD